MIQNKKLTINEIFYSIQGESYLSGLPCIFIRLTGCHQRCVYCDTEYAFYEGKRKTIEDIIGEIKKFPCQNVLLTGGEPLLQSNTPRLAETLLQNQYQVAIETAGNRDISILPQSVIKIMDLKTPGSGECERNNYNNLEFLEAKDEIKFVMTNDNDVDWSLKIIREKKLDQICHLSFSPANDSLLPLMADKILQSGLPIRLQVQLHKLIWPQKERGY